MKRILAFVTLLCLVTVLFVGCTKKDDNVSHNDNGVITEDTGKNESSRETHRETQKETQKDSQKETENDSMGEGSGIPGSDSSGMGGADASMGEEGASGESGGTDASGSEESTMPGRSRGIRRF